MPLRLLSAGLLALLVLGFAPAPAQAQSLSDAVAAAARRVLIPAAEAFARQSADMGREAAAFCAGPADEAGLNKARQDFNAALNSWQRLNVALVGPSAEGTRPFRILFWPDKRNQVTRAYAQLMQTADPATITVERLHDASAAMRGLSVLERLLHDSAPLSGFAASGPLRCAALTAAVEDMRRTAQDIADEWRTAKDPAAFFAEEGGADYAREAGSRLLTLMMEALTLIEEAKLGAPLGDKDAAAPALAETWRSGQSLANIAANLAALRALYGLNDGVAPPTLAGAMVRAGGMAENTAINAGFGRAEAALAAIRMPLQKAVDDDAERPKVEALKTAVHDLRETLGKALATKLGLTVGFNGLDGD